MDREKVENEKRSKKLTICLYLIPLILAVIIALVYIFIQQNFLLIIFAVLMFVILFGWDGSSRICPECKWWNAIIWTKVEKETREVKNNNKGKKQNTKNRITKMEGKCKYCNKIVHTEKKRLI